MVNITEEKWQKIKELISDAIEFAEGLVGGDESETLKDLKAREETLTITDPS